MEIVKFSQRRRELLRLSRPCRRRSLRSFPVPFSIYFVSGNVNNLLACGFLHDKLTFLAELGFSAYVRTYPSSSFGKEREREKWSDLSTKFMVFLCSGEEH